MCAVLLLSIYAIPPLFYSVIIIALLTLPVLLIVLLSDCPLKYECVVLTTPPTPSQGFVLSHMMHARHIHT